MDTLHPTTAEIRYEQILKGDHSRLTVKVNYCAILISGDVTDTLFRVVESGAMAGQVLLTGTVGVEMESFSINIRVSQLGFCYRYTSQKVTVSMN